MARDESDREDLLREATALLERIELRLSGATSGAAGPAGVVTVVVGFRAADAASFYFGADPVYQFNTAGELRRAFCAGLLFKASSRRLVSLRREHRGHEVQLVRRRLTDDEQTGFLAQMQGYLRALANDLAAGSYRVTGQIPPDADVLGRVRRWLAEHDGTRVATRPNVLCPADERCG